MKRCTCCGQSGHYAPRCPTPDAFERERREARPAAIAALARRPQRMGGTVTRSVNMLAAEWRFVDEHAVRAQMSRSQFLRQAAEHFIARLWPEEHKP